jgi:DNA-directed RNA polymerase specialized sigma subunit
MSVVQELPDPVASDPVASDSVASDWADETRRVITRELLVRAAHARAGEARALEFRALHLNLPLVREVAERLGLTDGQRRAVEHHALDGLHQAVGLYDPFGPREFAEFAEPFVEHQVRAHLPRPTLRLALHRRVALAIARV